MWPFRADFLWGELGKHRFQLGLISSLSFLPVFQNYQHQQRKKCEGVSKTQWRQRTSESTGDKDARGQCFTLKSEVSSKWRKDTGLLGIPGQCLPGMHKGWSSISSTHETRQSDIHLWPQDLGMGQVRGANRGIREIQVILGCTAVSRIAMASADCLNDYEWAYHLPNVVNSSYFHHIYSMVSYASSSTFE